ncbi:MAG: MFS family major facilitator transporter [Microgenomates group bacterium GW2011_GWC1_37_8]|uniref:MFS family major facilitator transporter n=1 Tax=Candidatus Woesebacteria bacterium GW2011_GWB1_38_8 TaxID=1618570 RepID=A0A0G0P6Q5_9BACT|nr:MAG: MFS family major facilitator transporter [Microgenomates group bacterium GW2011_GWC1_37_8]KKQ85001.1 MAG: MFS family major facilitator transporter [Candidatus Woesebacteria bacterium GW2011_GWB1_38_8]
MLKTFYPNWLFLGNDQLSFMISYHLPTGYLHKLYLPSSDLTRLLFSGVIRKTSVTLLQIFSPVYIYSVLINVYSRQNITIFYVLLYYALSFLIKNITQIVIAENISRFIGFKNTIRLSLIPYLLFLPFILSARNNPFLFIFSAIFYGISAGLYWWGYHGYFVKKGEFKHYGETVGEANFLESLVMIVTPLIGAYVTILFGFPALFLLAALLIVISIIVLGHGSKTRQKQDVKFIEVLKLVVRLKSTSVAYVGAGGEAVIAAVVWPLFLYLFFGKVISLGLIVSGAALISAVIAIFVGRISDIKGEGTIIRIGAPILAFSWLVRIFNLSIAGFVIGDALRNFGQRMIVTPLNALSYRKAFEAETAKAILFLEINENFGIILMLLLLSFVILAGGSLWLAFLLASLFAIWPIIPVIKNRFEG